ncbi:MAG: methylisocitrate lyase [Gammaproteobacteria bacterium]|nr:methylisocitrate lyase [Gammaproteobacteria bacterium]|tara:strand:- start:2652 stop:3530 length:879 start_codon:yes stop_codon:yes gene_type:complete
MTPGEKFRLALSENKPLQVVGTINAYCAMLAETAGHRAIYLSGGGVANASFGLPDLGITTLADVTEDVQRICNATDLPLLVDIDTGWGGAFNISRTIKNIEKAGAAGVHIEDQVSQKRCGHRPNKSIVSKSEMIDRIKAAVDGKKDSKFMVMARTDALAVEGIDAALDRAVGCVEAGADAIFPEAILDLEQYKLFTEAIDVPVLANITEFGKTPLYTRDQLRDAGVSIVLYPLSAFRAMSKAALDVYKTIADKGSQTEAVNLMQTRDELYETLNYHSYERKLDKLFSDTSVD